MKKAWFVLILAAWLAHVGCNRPEVAENVAGINAIYEAHSSVVTPGDVENWLTNYSETVVFIPGDTPPISGKEAVRLWAQDFYRRSNSNQNISIEKVRVSGDLAFALWNYTFEPEPESGSDARLRNGRVIHILERQHDNSWKIIYHIAISGIS